MSIKRILFVITGLGLGGAEKQVCLLADKFAELDCEVKIVSLTGNPILKPNNKSVEIIPLDLRKNIFSVLKKIFYLKRIYSVFRPDVIHGHMFHANIFTRLVRIISDSKAILVNTAHSKNEGGKLRMWLYKLTDPLCDLTTNVSHEALSEFIRVGAFKPTKAVTMYNGIDTNIFKYSAEERKKYRREFISGCNDRLLLSVGRLTKAKDYPTLLKAMSLLPDDYKLVIVGEGEERNLIESFIVQHQLASRVFLIGIRDDVNKLYSACDLFIISSLWEGFGLVVAEAMSCQRIVIGTDAGGVREVIGNDRFIVPTSQPSLLAQKIMEINKFDHQTCTDIGYQNRDFICKNFGIDNIVQKWLHVYKLNN